MEALGLVWAYTNHQALTEPHGSLWGVPRGLSVVYD